MKKTYLLLAVAASFLATGCYSTYGVYSRAQYEKAKTLVEANMEVHGYNPSGYHTDSKNEIVVTGQSYSKYAGFGTLLDNNDYQYETLYFANKSGETAEYSVKYQVLLDDNRQLALQNVQVLGCRTSKAADYKSLCTDTYSPQKLIGEMYPDTQRSHLNGLTTALAVIGMSAAVSLAACWLLLL